MKSDYKELTGGARVSRVTVEAADTFTAQNPAMYDGHGGSLDLQFGPSLQIVF